MIVVKVLSYDEDTFMHTCQHLGNGHTLHINFLADTAPAYELVGKTMTMKGITDTLRYAIQPEEYPKGKE